MDLFIIAIVATLLIVLVLAIPHAPEVTAHEQQLAEMDQTAADAKRQITRLHRAYRTELTRSVKARAVTPRRRP